MSDAVVRLARRKGAITAADLHERGIPARYLSRLCARRSLVRVARGVYAAADIRATAAGRVLAASRRAPAAVICLRSALWYHGLVSQAPEEVWLAVCAGSRTPKTDPIATRTVRMAPAVFESGIEVASLGGGGRAPVYSPEKTLADCFRYRSRVGVETARAALEAALRGGMLDMQALWHFARVCRVSAVMRPFVERVELEGGGRG